MGWTSLPNAEIEFRPHISKSRAGATMIDKIFTFESTRSRHREAPLFNERNQYLSYMLDHGVSRNRLRTISSMLLHVVRLMAMDHLRMVSVEEVREAGHRWESDITPHKLGEKRHKSQSSFAWIATKWFQFHGQIEIPRSARLEPASPMVEQFVQFLKLTLGLSLATIRGYESRSHLFLSWVLTRHESLSTVSLQDVDDYLNVKRDDGCKPRTIASYCAALRSFFRYSEMRGWNNFKIARGIQAPRIPRYDAAPRGPKWNDVRRLLNRDNGTKPVELRAAAVISLCAIYAIRST
jgi:hypothetical protein